MHSCVKALWQCPNNNGVKLNSPILPTKFLRDSNALTQSRRWSLGVWWANRWNVLLEKRVLVKNIGNVLIISSISVYGEKRISNMLKSTSITRPRTSFSDPTISVSGWADVLCCICINPLQNLEPLNRISDNARVPLRTTAPIPRFNRICNNDRRIDNVCRAVSNKVSMFVLTNIKCIIGYNGVSFRRVRNRTVVIIVLITCRLSYVVSVGSILVTRAVRMSLRNSLCEAF